MAILLYLEIRSIGLDQDQRNRDQAFATCDQLNRFQNIADTLQGAITASQNQFQATMGGIDIALATANKTLIQTQPHAIMWAEAGAFNVLPDRIVANIPYAFDTHYMNTGTESGLRVRMLTKISTGKPDDLDTEKDLSKKFEESWKSEEGHDKISTSYPQITGEYYSDFRVFSQQEVDGFANATRTIYYLSRIEYSDSTGRWRSDRCGDVQIDKGILSPQVDHPCAVFTQYRYRVRRK